MASTDQATKQGSNPLDGLLPAEWRAKLRKEFENKPFETHGSIWNKLWGDSFTPWDRGQPSPALVDLLMEREDLLGKSVVSGDGPESGRRSKRALVPGCGKGYDVLLLSALGYEAVGLEISETALKAAQEFAQKEYPEYAKRLDSNQGEGSYRFMLADFFKDDWLKELGWDEAGVELIYDYTFFVALPPEKRPEWALRMTQLLSSKIDGRLVCLEFPTFKDPNTGGPPHGVTGDMYVAHLSRPGEPVPYNSEGHVEAGSSSFAMQSDGGLERIAHFQPKRSHPVGQGTDWISVWRHL